MRTKRDKPSSVCMVCGARLAGIGKGAKTRKRPERKFAGVLCHRCTSEVIKYSTRVSAGAISIDDVPLKYKAYVEGMR